jgi:CDP-glycerol glycerophosphotransferase (TagB/SpsB family)
MKKNLLFRICHFFQALFEAISGHILLLISYLTIRNKYKFILGCHTGFMDNPKYLYFELLKNKNVKAFWYAKNNNEFQKLKKKGLPVVYKHRLKGLYHLLTAGTYVCSHILRDELCEWTTGNVEIVVLWHGVGIKELESKTSKPSLYRSVMDNYILHHHIKASSFLVTSDEMATFFGKYKQSPPNTLFFGSYPRCDFLKKGKTEIINHLMTIKDDQTINVIELIKKYSKVYIYMPTWRDNNQNFIEYSGFNSEQLNEALKENNSLFILKLHPNTNVNLVELSSYSNFLVLDKFIDIYPILPFTDCMITDYSSIYFDYLILENKEMLLFLFDIDTYIKENRDLTMDIDYAMPGVRAYSFADLLDIIKTGKKCPYQNRERIMELFWGKATKSVVETIVKA